MPRQPESPPEAVRVQEELLQRAAVYRRLFNREDGQVVWADLCRQFGFAKSEMKDITDTSEVVARRVAMRQPLFYIQEMREIRQPKKVRPAETAITQESEPESP